METLIDAKQWMDKNPHEVGTPINQDILQAVSVYLRRRYTYTETLVRTELKHFNDGHKKNDERMGK